MRFRSLATAMSMGLIAALGISLGPAASPADAGPSRPGKHSTGITSTKALRSLAPGTYSQPGLVLEDVHIKGNVLLTGDNQVVRNSRIDGELIVRGSSGTRVIDSEIGAFSVSGARNVTAQRLDIFGATGKDGIHVTSDTGQARNIVITDSWIHSPKLTPTSHYDGIQVRGVRGLTLRNNSWELGPHQPQFTAAVFLEDANGGNYDAVIDSNYIDGGGYAMYLYGNGITVTNNVFGPNARWGLLFQGKRPSPIVQSGNRLASGKGVQLDAPAPSSGKKSTTSSTKKKSVFPDVPSSHRWATEIGWLSTQGITTGYTSDGTFRPARSVTRGEFAAFLYRYEHGGKNPAKCRTQRFPDVPRSHWACGHIEWLATTGITTGYASGTFGPDHKIRRDQLAAMLARYHRSQGKTSARCDRAAFRDMRSTAFCAEVTWLAGTGIAQGYPDGTFRPTRHVSRQHVAAFLHRYDAAFGR